jgi:hypothetical protein
MRKLIAVLAICAVGAGCSANAENTADKKPLKTDAAGHVIAEGDNWSGAGGRTGDNDGDGRPDEGTDPKDLAKAYDIMKCGVPPTLTPEQKEQLPPGFDPDDAFPEPANDFPMRASVTPGKGDAGDDVTITVIAPGQANALIVVFGRFFDKEHHGMRAAQFADATGRATLKGPIPKDAPVGIATIAVSASKRNAATGKQETALKTLKFTVTGPKCR